MLLFFNKIFIRSVTMPKASQSPGSFLTLVLEKYNLNPFKLSKDIHLSQSAVRMITIGKTKITTPVAMRLAKYFNTNPEFWLVMQMKWDIAEANKDKALIKIVKSIAKVKKAPASGGSKTTAAKKPRAAKKKTAKTRKTAKRGRKPATPRANTRKVAAKRGRKPAASKVRTRKVAAKRGRKPVGRRGRPAKK
jgi:addiction module HigA family antidote